jgi:hypothetical protein
MADETKERSTQPYNILPKRTAERIPKTFYYYNGEVRWWDGKQLRNKEYYKKYTAATKENKREYQKEYYKTNKKTINEKNRKYQAANKERRNEKQRNRYKNDEKFKMKVLLRTRFRIALKSQNTKKNKHVLQLTSCTMDFLRDYISQQFEKGMTWDNHGDWHIDHRKPCRSFDLTKIEEQRKCFHYTNLQPMWGSENLQKCDKFNEATFEYTWVEHKGWEKNGVAQNVL